MSSKRFRLFWALSCVGVLAASSYPICMGIKVLRDMIVGGSVTKENYPKYIIPYTPIAAALLIGVLLMPLFVRLMKNKALIGGTLCSTVVFFISEIFLEKIIVVTTAETYVKLEDWQMFMCYIPPNSEYTVYKTHTAVEILMGEYSPAFKLHFYMISVIMIFAVLNCLYGFGLCVKNGDKRRMRPLIMQSVSAFLLLGLCILACFTAFWRDGSLQVSALSASLMAAFFIILGVTFGIFAGSFAVGKPKWLSCAMPTAVAAAVTAMMYVGEMILLSGNVYKFGNGILFDPLPAISLAPVDILIILLSGTVTAIILALFAAPRHNPE